MEYKKLEKEFDKKGFHFKEVWREGDYCIYSMANDNKILSYESFKTHITPEYEMGGIKIESKEWFPSWNEVGVKMAHSCGSLWQAHEKIKEYKEKIDVSENPPIQKEIQIPTGEFTVTLFSQLNNMSYINSSNWVKANLNIKVKFLYEKNTNLKGRGKASKFYTAL